MQTKLDTFLTSKLKRLFFVITALVLLYIVYYINNPHPHIWECYFDRPWFSLVIEWCVSLIFCVCISEATLFTSKYLDKRIAWTAAPGLRFIIEMGVNLLMVIIINLAISLPCLYICEKHGLSLIGDHLSGTRIIHANRWLIPSTTMAFLFVGAHIINQLILNWKNEAIRVAQLSQIATEAELQSLKFQIDPHFVFNNLSVLSELILDNQQLGYDYAENFSMIYRYMLVNARKNTILLADELSFLHSYIFLIRHRFGEAIRFEINIDEESWALSMPPLTLQLLVENVLKHNKISKKEPLAVQIFTNDQHELVVCNELVPIDKQQQSSGIGISNIVRRYALLSDKQPRIVNDTRSFKVILPLLKL